MRNPQAKERMKRCILIHVLLYTLGCATEESAIQKEIQSESAPAPQIQDCNDSDGYPIECPKPKPKKKKRHHK